MHGGTEHATARHVFLLILTTPMETFFLLVNPGSTTLRRRAL